MNPSSASPKRRRMRLSFASIDLKPKNNVFIQKRRKFAKHASKSMRRGKLLQLETKNSTPVIPNKKNLNEVNIFPNPSIQKKMDIMMTPYNSALNIQKHMDFE
jgi:hypothetical protein